MKKVYKDLILFHNYNKNIKTFYFNRIKTIYNFNIFLIYRFI